MKKPGAILKKGESESRAVSVNGEVVKLHHVTKTTKGNMVCEWSFDFKDVSREELIKLASRSLVIDQRPPAKVSKKPEEWASKEWRVRDLIDNKKRKSANPVEKAAKALGLSPEQIEELLKKEGLLD